MSQPSYRGSYMSDRFYLTGWIIFWFLVMSGSLNLGIGAALTYSSQWHGLLNIALGLMNVAQAFAMILPALRDEQAAREAAE